MRKGSTLRNMEKEQVRKALFGEPFAMPVKRNNGPRSTRKPENRRIPPEECRQAYLEEKKALPEYPD